MLDKIKEQSQDGTIVVPVGVGSAFAKKNHNSSFIIAYKGNTLLFDLGATVPLALSEKGIKITDFDAYYISHAHADHCGGLEELLFMSRYVTKTKPTLIGHPEFLKELWNKTLSGGLEKSESEGTSNFSDWVERVYTGYRVMPTSDKHATTACRWNGVWLRFPETLHVPSGNTNYDKAMYSTGIAIHENNEKKAFAISGDSQFTPTYLEELSTYPIIFHDCQLFDAPEDKLVHATYNQLKTLPDDVRAKMWLYHYGDNFEQLKPEEDGFAGFVKPWEIYKT